MILSRPGTRALLAACAMFAIGGMAFAQSESALIKRPAQLRDAPGDSSRTLAALPLQTPVTRLGERQGPWIKVRTADGTQGWVHMFDISGAPTAQSGNAGTGALRSISGFFSRGSGQSNAASLPTSTVGIRGLGAEDLANAQPNPAAVSQMESGRLDEEQARRFANLASLSSRTVSPLPAPSAPARAPSGGGGRSGGGGQFQGGG